MLADGLVSNTVPSSTERFFISTLLLNQLASGTLAIGHDIKSWKNYFTKYFDPGCRFNV